jgi:excisionase family DNA binding protein
VDAGTPISSRRNDAGPDVEPVRQATADGRPESKPPESAFISPAEYALLTGLSLSTVTRLLAKKKIPKLQPGGKGTRVLIPRDAVRFTKTEMSKTATNQVVAPLDADVPGVQGRLSGRQPLWMASGRL